MNDTLAAIISFVEGHTRPADFEKQMYGDPEMERILSDDPGLPSGSYVGSSTYLYVLEQDYKSLRGIIHAHGALSQFLERKRIACRPTKEFSELHAAILKAQPGWLDVPLEWLDKHVLPSANGRKKKELQDWLREQLLDRFKYRGKPPKWIQSPAWPIGENGPHVFLGQLRVPDYFHDEAAVYVFHDPKSGSCETVMQVY